MTIQSNMAKNSKAINLKPCFDAQNNSAPFNIGAQSLATTPVSVDTGTYFK